MDTIQERMKWMDGHDFNSCDQNRWISGCSEDWEMGDSKCKPKGSQYTQKIGGKILQFYHLMELPK